MTIPGFSTQTLPGRALLRVAGPEAKSFLQGLLTADVAGLAAGEARYGALLSPQGKMLFDLFVYDTGEGLLIDCAAPQAEALLKRLTMYKLRAQVTLARDEALAVGVSPSPPKVSPGFADPRLAALGWRFAAPMGSLPAGEGYEAARLAAGLADSVADLGSGEFFPHEANLDQFGGVSFSKGCYVGQEVVSRMEHRGTARSRMLPVVLDAPAPPKGSDIRSGEASIGTLLSSAGQRALALIRLDRLAEAPGPLLTEGVRLRVQKPAFARYDVARSKD
jgi:folate-binding protein YgfZ